MGDDSFDPPSPKLAAVKTSQRGEGGHWLLTVSVDMRDGLGVRDLPFDYDPGDRYGLTPQVTAWLAANNYTLES